MKTHLACSGLLLALALAGCRDGGAPVKPQVVASFYPLYEFAREVAREHAPVTSLVPSGVEPHDWEPSPQDLITFQKARLFIYNGIGMEPWVDKLIGTVGSNGPQMVEATEGLPVMPAPANISVGGRNGVSPPPDPHLWLDPVLAQSMVEKIRGALAAADPANAAIYSENARTYRTKLQTLHEAFERGLEVCEQREIVVSHAAFGYLVRRYRLSQRAVSGLGPESEPNPAQLAAIVSFAKRARVTHVFSETLIGSRVADTLAREVRAKTLILNPIEGLTREEAVRGLGYVALMEANLNNLRTALRCR